MARKIRIAAVQAAPIAIDDNTDALRTQVRDVVATHAPDLIVFPELHCFGADHDDLEVQNARLRASAISLDEARARYSAIARDHGVWLLPGTICERSDGPDPYNAALLFDPDGHIHASYRKVFPWRPSEPYTPGEEFVVADLPGFGRVGLSICYDAWFPEVTRHLAWMGAELVLNVVKTTTPDRPLEQVLARANSIVNQNFTVSVNVAGPIGVGGSIVVGPEGEVIAQADTPDERVLVVELDLDEVARVRDVGSMNSVTPWKHFAENDQAIPLPMYNGYIDPAQWRPGAGYPAAEIEED